VSANLASLELETGNPVEAARLFQSTLRKLERAVGPDHPHAILTRLNLGLAYRAQGRYDEAAQHLAAAASHDNAPVSAKITAATYFQMDTPARDVALALRLAREAVEATDRAEPGAMALLARTLQSAGRVTEAYSTWAEVVALPGAGAVHFNEYAWFLLNREGSDAADAVEALNYAQKASEMENNGNATHLDTLALAYHRTNDHVQAIEAAEQAVSLLDPSDAVQLAAFRKRLEEYRAAAELIPESR
jgi:tetratricopeptide (TPR) repeat protein